MQIQTAKTNKETLYYIIEQTWLGYCLLVAKEVGICSVILGDDANQLEKDFLHSLSSVTSVDEDAADVSLVDTQYKNWFTQALAFIQDNRHAENSLTLPLSMQGTPLQEKVWRALQTIPYGETRTYSELAELIGKPKAVRAIASACGANRIALLVPCHRVVRKGAGLGGYRWGLERKARLLKRESSCV